MKKTLAFWLSITLFTLGDLVSKPMNKFDWSWIHPMYNKLMTWSSNIQDQYKCNGPWQPVKQKKRKKKINKKLLKETESQ
jgi:hypothetical protein